MSTTESTPDWTWTGWIVKRSLALGALYLTVQVVYAATGWDVVWPLPPLAYGGFLLSERGLGALWTCPACGHRTVGTRCGECDHRLVDTSVGHVLVQYVLVVPTGAAVAVLLLLFPLAVVAPLVDALIPTAGLHGATSGLFGFVGPLPYLLFTAITAMVAATAAVGILTMGILARSVIPGRQ